MVIYYKIIYMKMKKSFFVGFIFGLFCLCLHAQYSSLNNYVTRIWTTADGLPGNVVSDIIQGQDGFLYFGSYECLLKFDGFEFEPSNKYTNEELSFVSARCIFEDSSGNMWIGSNGEGVQRISRNKIVEHISVDSGLPSNSIRCFTEDRYGNIWVGTASGLAYINHEHKIVIPVYDNGKDVSHVIIKMLYCDTADRIWMITNEVNGLYLYSDFGFQHYKELDVFGDYVPSCIAQDKNGAFWIALNNEGLVKIQNGEVSKVETGTFLDYRTTNTIYCDKTGSLWFGTEKGLVLYRDGVFSVYDEDHDLSNSSINKIIGDREGNIWIATDSSGIGKISPGKFRMNALDSSVNAICEDLDGNVWIGAGNGLFCYKNETFIQNELTEYCKGIRVRHVGLGKHGEILVNCYSKPGMIVYKDGEIRNWTTDDGLSGNKTRVSIETFEGDIYIGTTTGLSVIDSTGSIHNYSLEEGFDCEYVMWIYQDNDGIVWVGTDGDGIYLMKDRKIFRKINTDSGLAGNVIFKISQDHYGNHWICTGSGISFYRGSAIDILNTSKAMEFVNYNSAHGLGSDSLFQIIFDKNNYAWLISNRGIASVDYNSLLEVADGSRKKVDCKFYNQSDGLKSSGPNSTALSMIDRHGRIWFTMSDGFAIYDPLMNKASDVFPIAQILQVQVDDNIYKNLNSYTVVIPPDAKHINIKYTGLSYASSERIRFTYKLEGFDKDFSPLTADRVASFTKLSPGRYTFLVGCQNAEGLFSEVFASVQLVQKAYFYEHVWFWLIVAGLIIIIIAIVFILVIRTDKKRQIQLETKIQMATVELQMAKDESDRLLQNIIPVSIAQRLKAKGMGDYGTIADSFDDVTVLFSDIVSFTNTTSHYSATEIVEALNALIKRFDNSAKRLGVEKIKTIGDAYMAACGVPSPNKRHAEVMLKFAIQMYKDLADYNKTAKIKFRIRVGMNSGNVIAGIIGKNKFIYDIWGDTVNVASRMECNCNPGHIRMTEDVVNLITAHGYKLNLRQEEINVKGKGMMKTYEFPDH